MSFDISTLNLICREEWGAALPLKHYIPIFPNKIVIHQNGFKCKYTNTKTSHEFEGSKSIRRLQQKQIKKFGIIDLKDHFVISPDGLVYEGRPMNVAGCHCKKHDNYSLSIRFFGNYMVETPTRDQIHSFFILLKHIKQYHTHLDLPSCIFNHCDLNKTHCPGDNLKTMIDKIKQRKDISYV